MNGIAFRGERLFPVGAHLEIEFRIDSSHAEWFKAKGGVRHVTQDRMGVEFLELSEADKIGLLKAIYHELAVRRHR